MTSDPQEKSCLTVCAITLEIDTISLHVKMELVGVPTEGRVGFARTSRVICKDYVIDAGLDAQTRALLFLQFVAQVPGLIEKVEAVSGGDHVYLTPRPITDTDPISCALRCAGYAHQAGHSVDGLCVSAKSAAVARELAAIPKNFQLEDDFAETPEAVALLNAYFTPPEK